MIKLLRTLVLGLMVLIAITSCSVDDLFDAMDSMSENLIGTPDASTSAIEEIAGTTSRVNVECSSSYDKSTGMSVVSITITGVLSTGFELEGNYYFDDGTYIWLTALSDDEMTDLASALEEIRSSNKQNELLEYLCQDAPDEYSEAVNSTCTLLSDMLSDFDVSKMKLKSDTLEGKILDTIDSIGTLAEGDISIGEMLILRLISTDVISILKDSAVLLYYYTLYYGEEVTAISEDDLVDIFKDSADYLLTNFAIMFNIADIIQDDSEFACALIDLYGSVGDYITEQVN